MHFCIYILHTFFSVNLQPIAGLGHLIVEVSGSHTVNPLNAELNPIRHLLALAGAHHFVDVSRIRVKTHTHTHIDGSTPLEEWSARRREPYLHNTQQTQETNIHALSGIRTRHPSSQAASDLRHRRGPSCMFIIFYVNEYVMILFTKIIFSLSIVEYIADPSGRAVCGRSPVGIVCSNPAGDMDACLLRVLCAVR
jgi:hypothetical protein